MTAYFVQKNIERKGRLLSFLLIILGLVNVLYHININIDKYMVKYDPAWHEKRYLESQWRVPFSEKGISDAELYTYSGYKYIKGENPILLNPEQPPLGKYIIGLFIHLFGNGRLTSIFFAFLCLFLVLQIIFEATRSFFLSSLAFFLTATNSLFIDQIAFAPQLDIIQLGFFLTAAYFLIHYHKDKKNINLIFAGLSYGAMLSTKVFMQTFLTMSLFLALVLFFSSRNNMVFLKEIAIITFVGLLVFTLSYGSFFLNGGTVRKFLGVQKWIVEFYRASKIDTGKIFGTYIFLILFNKWKVWSEGYPFTKYQYWSIGWPIIFIMGSLVILKMFKNFKKASFEELFFGLWVTIYAVSLAFIPVFPRYLLLLFIPMIILICLYAKKTKVLI